MCTTRTGPPGAIILRAEKSIDASSSRVKANEARSSLIIFALASAFRPFVGTKTESASGCVALMGPALSLVQNVHRRYSEEKTDTFSFGDIGDLPICATARVCRILAEHGCVTGWKPGTAPGILAKAASVVASDVILKRLREKKCMMNAMDLEHVLWAVAEGEAR